MATTTYNIDIDGYIGDWGYSKEYVKRVLSENKSKPVTMRMSSQGGSLMHGLAISDRIEEHGNVEISMFGFNASSATLACLKAKKVNMASNGFYLIHKVMNSVVVWDNLNADQMRTLIAELETNATENDKIDQVIAQMYCDKTGKSQSEILELMKTGGWLNANEAKEWGFVDEVFKSTEKVNMENMESKLNAFGLPTNSIGKQNLFTSNKKTMKKQFLRVNSTLGVDQLESTDEGVFLNEAQIESLETQLETLENNVASQTTTGETLTAEVATLTAELASLTADAATKATEIEALNTQITNLQNAAGASTNDVNASADGASEESLDTFANTVKTAREMFAQLPK